MSIIGRMFAELFGEDETPCCGTHKHKCDHCGRVWEHGDDMAGDDAAHTCKCGQMQWWKYFGDCRVTIDEAVAVTCKAVRNGARACKFW